MSVLPDINILLACGWQQHPLHASCCAWLDSLAEFALCPITELGFLRVSMSPAFRATYEGASRVLESLTTRSKDGTMLIEMDMDAEQVCAVSL